MERKLLPYDSSRPSLGSEFTKFGIRKDKTLRKGMDYKTTDKTAYAVVDDPEKKLVLLVREGGGTNLTPIETEYQTLKHLKEKKIPAAKVYSYGTYEGAKAILMRRYVISSKAFVRAIKGEIQYPKTSKKYICKIFDTKLKCRNGIVSLTEISKGLKRCDIVISDIQFLVNEEGKFYINDPDIEKEKSKVKMVQEKTTLIFEALEKLLKEQLDELEEHTSTETEEEKIDWEDKLTRLKAALGSDPPVRLIKNLLAEWEDDQERDDMPTEVREAYQKLITKQSSK